MPPKDKKPRKKVDKKPRKKKVSNATKQRQAINVKIKIDQSRRTNPRQPQVAGKTATLPTRGYSANASTPLHTTIMTATPSPTVIQREPSYASEVKQMFQDADFKTNKQITSLAGELDRRDEQLLNELARTQQPSTSQLYDSLIKYHQGKLTGTANVEELPDEVAFEGVNVFEDPNAKAASKFKRKGRPIGSKNKPKVEIPVSLNPLLVEKKKKKLVMVDEQEEPKVSNIFFEDEGADY